MHHPGFWAGIGHSMMLLGVPALEKIIRSIVIYFFLIIGLRLAGKRELAQMNPFDLVVLLILSNAVQNAIIGNDNSLLGGAISATTLLVLNYVVVRVLYRRRALTHLIEGRPDILIDNGKIKEARLKAELITKEELSIAANKQGFDSLNQIEKAVLLPNGTMLFTGKDPQPQEARYNDIIKRLDAVSMQIKSLNERLDQQAKS